MPVSDESFVFASFAGVWPLLIPSNQRLERLLYRCYTLFVSFTMTIAVLSMITHSLLYVRTLHDFSDVGFFLITVINAYVKGVNMILRNGKVDELRRMFLKKMCLVADQEEAETCRFYTLYARYTVIVTASIAEFTALCVSVLPLFITTVGPKLPLSAWYPFEIASGSALYYLIYVHQSHICFVTSAWNGADDALLSCFILEICAQLQLLAYRLKRLPREIKAFRENFSLDEKTELVEALVRRKEARTIKQCVQHHLHILKMAEQLQVQFLPNMISQFVLCTVILCLNVYQLAMKQSSVYELVILLVYLNTMLIELLLYCWFGNELIYKSLHFNDNICEMDWTSLQVQTQKKLLLLMKRAHAPINLTCGPFITLSTESYTSILKFSYSMYNVLK